MYPVKGSEIQLESHVAAGYHFSGLQPWRFILRLLWSMISLQQTAGISRLHFLAPALLVSRDGPLCARVPSDMLVPATCDSGYP